MIRQLNYLLWWFGVQVVPRPASVKSLIEYSNALEVYRPVGPPGARWIRSCAQVVARLDTDRRSDTVRDSFVGTVEEANPSEHAPAD